MSRTSRPRGFTLVEMLVVIGIIGILAALLLPAVYAAVVSARNANMTMELTQLADAIEAYKKDKGDYPPNFREYDVVIRHIRRCYPKATTAHLNLFIQAVWGPSYSLTMPPAAGAPTNLDEGECLVFWLGMTTNDPTLPFNYATGDRKTYFDFQQNRLFDGDGDGIPSYRPKYARESYYIYMDSRSYDQFVASTTSFAFAEEGITDPAYQTRPYWSEVVEDSTQTDNRLRFKPMNESTFQLICAGQDGEFGELQADPSDVKFFPSAQNYFDGDKDNLTNFSEGKTLADSMP